MVQAFSIIIHAIFRRVWGGWFSPNNLLKRILAFIFPFVAFIATFGIDNYVCGLIVSAIALFAFLMPYHGYGISMGEAPYKPLWKCVAVMCVQYGLASAAICAVKYFCGVGMPIPFGFLVPLFYYVGWKIFPFGANIGEYPKGNVMIDGGTSVGEFGLGAMMMATVVM